MTTPFALNVEKIILLLTVGATYLFLIQLLQEPHQEAKHTLSLETPKLYLDSSAKEITVLKRTIHTTVLFSQPTEKIVRPVSFPTTSSFTTN